MSAPGAWAQSAKEVAAGGQVRDAVVDAGSGYAFFAVYDKNEVWKTRLADGQTVASVSVGQGPVALALSSDGKMLACANRLSGTVSLISIDDFSVKATAPCGLAPGDAAALPGGGFAIVNSLGDTVTLVDPAKPETPVVLANVTGVPNAVAASEGLLAVAIRVPASLLLFASGATSPSAVIPLPGPPTALSALPNDRFAAAADGKILVVDGKAQSVVAEAELTALDLAVSGEHIVALLDDSIQVLDSGLAPVTSHALGAPAQRLAVSGDVIAALSPQVKAWHLYGMPEPPVETIAKKPEEAAPEREPRTVEPKPLGAEQPTAKPRKPSSAPIPTQEDSPRIAEAIEKGLTLGATEGGFEPPDWTKPPREFKADGEVLYQEGGQRIIAHDNVSFWLDTIEFKTDNLYYDRKTGELTATGNVSMKQGESVAYADEIRYVLDPSRQEEAPPPLTSASPGDGEELSQKMLSLGSLDATNIEIIEPTRQLKADRIVYDFKNESGQAFNVAGQSGNFYFGAEQLDLLGATEAVGEKLWLTTCSPDTEYYRVRMQRASISESGAISGKGAQLELGKIRTPVYWPRWGFRGGEAPTIGFDFDSGRSANLGYYVNVGQQFAVAPNVRLGYRFWPTQKEGVGFGIEGKYNFMEEPSSLLFRSSGKFRSLYTTESRGHVEWYHRHELLEDTVLLAQVEHWFDKDFYKDFYYDDFGDRSEPRTFVNVAHTKPGWIATATVRPETTGFVAETERLPEASYHLLERKLADRLYFTFDTIGGYNEREPSGTNAIRLANVARVTYDIEPADWIDISPFLEGEATWYSKTLRDGGADYRLSTLLGTTAQTRLHKGYAGRWGFSGFKHLIVPSITWSYRPSSTLNVEDTPRFDAYDNVYGRHRVEGKLDNILFGRDAETEESWQVARLTLYHGNDFWNEFRNAQDYEVEFDIRPRPLWGFQFVGEHHSIERETNIDEPYLVQRTVLEAYERFTGEPYDPEVAYLYNAQYGDYDRVLTYFYYDDTDYDGRLSGRIGYAYTKTQDRLFNKEIIYGLGYKVNDKWNVAFEHRFDLERSDLYRQQYEVRRVFDCIEGAVKIRERGSGWDFNLEFSVTDFGSAKSQF